LSAERKALLFVQMKGNGRRTDEPRETLIDRKPGRRVDDLVARRGVDVLAETDGRFGSGKDDHLLRGDRDPSGFGELVGYGLAQTGHPLRIGVMGVAEIELSLDLFADVVGKLEIGFTDIAADDPMPSRLDLLNGGPNLESILGVDEPDAFGEKHHEILLRGFARCGPRRSRHDVGCLAKV
jgi:hypothetical protein